MKQPGFLAVVAGIALAALVSDARAQAMATTASHYQLLFGGDVLFAGSIGRTDLPAGVLRFRVGDMLRGT